MGVFLRYTGARALLFAIALGVLYLLGARQLLLFVLALLVSALASYVLLSKQRDELSLVVSGLSGSVKGRLRDFRARLEAGAASEDAAADELRAEQEQRAAERRRAAERHRAAS